MRGTPGAFCAWGSFVPSDVNSMKAMMFKQFVYFDIVEIAAMGFGVLFVICLALML